MFAGSSHEIATRPSDRRTSCEVFRKIETELREARSSNDTVKQALTRVRTMLHNDHRDIKIIRKFVIDDEFSFSEWHVVVRYPDGREVKLTHE